MTFPALVEPAAELTIDEVRRYSRHLIIPDVGMTGQKRLKNAKVLVIGAGGLGSPALMYLAAAGVGTLGIVEFDEVDESNLQRQIIHGQSDVGRPKAESATGLGRRDQPAGRGRGAPRAPRQRQRLPDLRGLRPHRRRHRQLRDPLPRQRRGVLPADPVRLGLHLPLRRAGLGVLAARDARGRHLRRRPLLPLPLPRAPAAGHGPELRRGRCARCPVREHRLDPGQRGDQGDHRYRRPRCRPPGHLRRPRAGVAQAQGAQGPRLRAVRRQPDRHRPDRLRRLLRRDLRGGRGAPLPARRSR